MSRHNRDLGRAGEFLAAYILETHGIEVHHVDRAGADLWCKVRGSIVTVQVKACAFARSTRNTSKVKYYSYMTHNTEADWFCFVAMDRQLIVMKPVSEITTKSFRLTPTEFNEANQRRTIEEMLNSC